MLRFKDVYRSMEDSNPKRVKREIALKWGRLIAINM